MTALSARHVIRHTDNAVNGRADKKLFFALEAWDRYNYLKIRESGAKLGGKIHQGVLSVVPEQRWRSAWPGRVTGCRPGKPLEALSFRRGPEGVAAYLRRAGAWPLHGYLPPGEKVSSTRVRDAAAEGGFAVPNPTTTSATGSA